MSEIDSYAIEEYFLNKAEEELEMSEKDRCLTALEGLELELRLARRVVDIYEDEISKLKEKNYFLEEEIKGLKKEKYKLLTALERGIS